MQSSFSFVTASFRFENEMEIKVARIRKTALHFTLHGRRTTPLIIRIQLTRTAVVLRLAFNI